MEQKSNFDSVMDVVIKDIWQYLKENFPMGFIVVVCGVWWLISTIVSIKGKKSTPIERYGSSNNNEGSQSAPIVQSNRFSGDAVFGNENKITRIYTATEKSPAEKQYDLVDAMVKKIQTACRTEKIPMDKISGMFGCMVRCIFKANKCLSLDETVEFILVKWSSEYGSLRDVREQLFLATNEYLSAGNAYYEVTPNRAEELGLDAITVQNEVWRELNHNERMILVLYGATRCHYDIEAQDNGLNGTGFAFSMLVKPYSESDQFGVSRIVFRLLADAPMDIVNIMTEEYQRCKNEKKVKGMYKSKKSC